MFLLTVIKKMIPLLIHYFSGLGYTIGRVPIGASDYSLDVYSYAEVPGDMNLTYFALGDEDIKYKVRHIKIYNLIFGDHKL
jgi:glucosylceramidase